MRNLTDDRGAILIHVAFALIALMAFSAFAIDYGLFWESRRQAQNSADAAAMSGAISLAYDDPSDSTGVVASAAYEISQKNLVWGEAPSVIAATDIHTPATGFTCPDDGTPNCVRVDVYRTAARGDALPIFFGQLVGLVSQDVRATATAKVQTANSTDCLKPWAVIDRWDEYWPQPPTPAVPWNLNSTFDKYDSHGNLDPSIPPADYDYYDPPVAPDHFGTGFHPYNKSGQPTPDLGLHLTLKQGTQSDFNYAAGWFSELNLFDSRGGNDYENNIKHCVGVTYTIGDQLPINTKPGQTVGPTAHGVEQDVDSLINQDPNAEWDPVNKKVINSDFGISPRIVAIPLVDPDAMANANKNGFASVPIANIAGFFVNAWNQSTKSVDGYLVTMPGMYDASSTSKSASFLKVITLIR